MTFVTAEIGINANGSVDIAKKMIDAAKWAGADAVKFQKRSIQIVYAGQLGQPRESPWGTTLGEQKYGIEFSATEYDQIAEYCSWSAMPWYASAWDVPSLEFLRKYDCPYIKIASAMTTNLPFIRAINPGKTPIFMSVGMCKDDDIAAALHILPECNVTLMHTVSTYPAKESELNLNCIKTLHNKWELPVGYSGHEASVSPSVAAVVLGAVAIERHLTLDRTMYGSDQAASLEPHGFKTMVEQIRKIPEILGDGIRTILPAEHAVAKKLRYWVTQ